MNDAQLRLVRTAFLCVFLLGAGVRATNMWRPIDTESWRESDVASIARNYFRESMNFFAPRIDWRGDGPGYTESECPFFPWLVALLYRLFGYHETIGRALSYIFSLLAFHAFISLARYLLPPAGALAASIVFAFSPLTVSIATSLQPDGLMFFLYVLSAYAFVRWMDEGSARYYVVAAVAGMMALLAKAPAAHIGVLFGCVLVARAGWASLKEWRIWLLAVVMLVPSVLWYGYARHLWRTYGNSLGLSNEHHWAGASLFQNGELIRGIAHVEWAFVLAPIGWGLIIFALVYLRREKASALCVYWLLAVFVYYLIAANTTSREWASYYHVVSVPPVALLLGTAMTAVDLPTSRRLSVRQPLVWFGGLALLSGLAAVLVRSVAWSHLLSKAAAVSILSGCVCVLLNRVRGAETVAAGAPSRSLWREVVGCVIAASFVASVGLESRATLDMLAWKRSELYECVTTFKPHIGPGDLIVASGGSSRGAYGHRVAYSKPYMFYWLDRKGFNLSHEEQSLGPVKELARRGAKFFLAEKASMAATPGFEEEIRRAFALKADCGGAYLFELAPGA